MKELNQYVILGKDGRYHFSPNHPSTYKNIVGGVNCQDIIVRGNDISPELLLVKSLIDKINKNIEQTNLLYRTLHSLGYHVKFITN